MLFFGETLLRVPVRNLDDEWTPENGVHYTMIFNTFVMMQVFNEINSRKIEEYEFDVFKGFCNNRLFVIIEVLTITVQIILVEYGGEAVKTSPLDKTQHFV